MNNDIGKISEATNTVSDIHNQEVVPSYDVNMGLVLPLGSDNALMNAMVKRRKIENDAKKIGTEHRNTLIDTISYEVEFIDGTTEILTSKIISKNLLAPVDK